MNRMREREQGFTLIEFLVVVIIIGILAAIAIPIYLGIEQGRKQHQQSCIIDVTTSQCSR